jgi:hypothetical protein
MPCPVFDTQPWVTGPPLPQRRVAIISTAGLHRRGDRPFTNPAGQVFFTLQQLRLLSERHLVPRAYSTDAAYK